MHSSFVEKIIKQNNCQLNQKCVKDDMTIFEFYCKTGFKTS